jgi:hypothetical protein
MNRDVVGVALIWVIDTSIVGILILHSYSCMLIFDNLKIV